MIPIRECTTDPPLTSDAIWEDVLGTVKQDQRVHILVNNKHDGTQQKRDVRWRRVLRFLLKEIGRDSKGPSRISSVIQIPLTAGLATLDLPPRFARAILTPDTASSFSANIGFANQVVAFHVDTGHAGLAALTGNCEKIWLVAPPLEHNIAALRPDNKPTFLSVLEKLTKLAVIHQTSDDVLFLPPGLIHATFTVKTGILYGNDFRTPENFFGSTMGMVATVLEDHDHDWSELDSVIGGWLAVLKHIARDESGRFLAEVVHSLCTKELVKLRYGGGLGKWSAQVEEVVNEFFEEAKLSLQEVGVDQEVEVVKDSEFEDEDEFEGGGEDEVEGSQVDDAQGEVNDDRGNEVQVNKDEVR